MLCEGTIVNEGQIICEGMIVHKGMIIRKGGDCMLGDSSKLTNRKVIRCNVITHKVVIL